MWRHITTNAPPLPRNSAGFVFDPATNNIVLTGGREGCGGDSTTYTDTWTLTGSEWQQQPESSQTLSPGGMQSFTATYDPTTSLVLALGIYSGCGVSTGEFSWNGSKWTAAPQNAVLPSPMYSRGLAYDAATRQLIAVGDAQDTSTGPASGEVTMQTWAYNGASWSQLHPATSPPVLEGMSVAYDAVSQQVVLFGGAARTTGTLSSPATNQTWAFDGTSWTQLTTSAAPPGRMDASMVYDDSLGKLVLFGGAGSSPDVTNAQPQVFGDMWTFDGATWQQLLPQVTPPARFDAQMTYDSATERIVLFGGALSTTTDSDETWTFGGE